VWGGGGLEMSRLSIESRFLEFTRSLLE